MKIRRTKEDILWSQLVRDRDKRCRVCFKTGKLNAHHIFRRGIHALRWVVDNGITLCFQCHTANFNFSAHKTPDLFKKWIKKESGALYQALEKISRIYKARSKALEEFREKYMKEIKSKKDCQHGGKVGVNCFSYSCGYKKPRKSKKKESTINY